MIELEQQLRDAALRPQDESFTRRTLAALPPRVPPYHAVMRRSFAVATRVGLALALMVGAQRWYSAGTGGPDTVFAILMFAVPAFSAVSWLCGPWIPRSLKRQMWRPGRNWL